MKKILLMMVLLGVFLNLDAQIIGAPTLIVGDQSSYNAMPSALGNVRYEWRVQGGLALVSASKEYATVKAVSPGSGILSVYYYNVNNQMIDYQVTNIVVNPNPKAPKIAGPDKIRTRSTYSYSIVSGSVSTWFVDKEYFEIISQNTKKITVKAKDKIGSTGISAYTTGEAFTSYMAIEIKTQDFKIVNSKSTVCNNELITYTLSGTEAGDVVNWQPISNMTLASGQGTATATFKASGNGYGKVKAIVTYDGKSYPVENSSVWVGKPAVTVISPVSGGWYDQNSSYIFSSKIDGASSGNEKWSVAGNAKLINAYGKIMTTYTGKQEGSFSVTSTVSNTCGTSAGGASGMLRATAGSGIPNEERD